MLPNASPMMTNSLVAMPMPPKRCRLPDTSG